MPEGYKSRHESAESDHLFKLQEYIKSKVEKIRTEEDIPLTQDCRLNPRGFNHISNEEKTEHELYVYDHLKKFSQESPQKERGETIGEQLELLKTAIFQKKLGSDFIVVRASQYDDIKNGIDNVIFDKKTGDIVCALDEVGDMRDEAREKKRKEIMYKNTKNGATLEYGLGISEENENHIIQKRVTHIPQFFLSLRPDKVREGVQEFNPGFSSSDFENKLFDLFTKTIYLQVAELHLHDEKLNPELKKKLDTFEEKLTSITHVK